LRKGKELAENLGTSLETIEIGNKFSLEVYAEKIYQINLVNNNEFNPKVFTKIVLEVTKQSKPDYIIIGATKIGKEIAARVAGVLGVGCMTDCIMLKVENKNIIGERLTYGGSTISKEICYSKPSIISVPIKTFDEADPFYKGKIIELEIEAIKAPVKVVKRRIKKVSDVKLDNARVIVSAGRGFKAKDDLAILEELAEVLGAKMACSRPISADQGWMEDWVGISGKKVKPMLYVACGISGTIQHIAGVRDSKIIISINNDESAGIHKLSDYSIVGDLYKVIPALSKAFKEQI
jgi:electron transfer flavoprotein alpha subunit